MFSKVLLFKFGRAWRVRKLLSQSFTMDSLLPDKLYSASDIEPCMCHPKVSLALLVESQRHSTVSAQQRSCSLTGTVMDWTDSDSWCNAMSISDNHWVSVPVSHLRYKRFANRRTLFVRYKGVFLAEDQRSGQDFLLCQPYERPALKQPL